MSLLLAKEGCVYGTLLSQRTFASPSALRIRHKTTSRVARFSSRANNKTLSRKERRLLERKERNRTKRESKTIPNKSESNTELSSTEKWQNMLNRFEFLVPKVPGRNVSFTHSSLWMALGLRLPLVLALGYLVTNENTSPYVIQGSLGPSMLPTIQFVGDLWVVETKAWQKGWRWLLENLLKLENDEDPSMDYQVGDLVIWEDTHGKRSCKRIVGIDGDTVDRFGEYRNLYKHRDDGGVLYPKKIEHVFGSLSNSEKKLEPSLDKIVVPKGCVWLEGDCPLFSMDSRQYGPINTSRIRGKLVFRLWPWNRDDLASDEANKYLCSCYVSKKRPIPYSSMEAYLGKRFGLYRVEASSNDG